MKAIENWPDVSEVVVAIVEESKFIVMLEEGLKLEPLTVVEAPTMPDDGVRVIEGTATVSVAWPVRVPVPTSPMTVRVNVPPGVELDVAIVRGVVEGLDAFEGNGIGLVRVTVELPGAPVRDSKMLLGRAVVVEPGASETLTV